MDTVDIRNCIIPCDTESPYIFVSYSSCDQALVYKDVLTLQQCGYNIWIDVHLDKSKPSWRDDVQQAIENGTCELLVYYASSSSLVSPPCYEELCTTLSDTARARRLGKPVNILVIEAEEIGNAVTFTEQLQERITADYHETKDVKDSKRETLHRIRSQFLNDNNRVRIRAKSTFPNDSGYYEEIERDLSKCRHSVRFTNEKLYRNAVKWIVKGHADYAALLLQIAAKQYVPAMLMLAHLYRGRDPMVANKWYEKADSMIPSGRWMERAWEYKETKFYSEALAFFLSYGERFQDGEALLRASQIWLGKGSRHHTIRTLRAAGDLGHTLARQFIGTIMSASDEKIQRMAFTDEAHVN